MVGDLDFERQLHNAVATRRVRRHPGPRAAKTMEAAALDGLLREGAGLTSWW